MKKKLLGLLVISMLLLLAIQPAFAGSRTYSHGMEDYRCMGSISSTTTESSMRIKMSVSFYDGGTGWFYDEGNFNQPFFKLRSSSVRFRHGQSYCNYYVNGSNTHNSIAPWVF